jgi:hypothetical protein
MVVFIKFDNEVLQSNVVPTAKQPCYGKDVMIGSLDLVDDAIEMND